MNAPFIDLSVHHHPKGISDRIAYGFTKMLRWTADTFFAERYGHRAVVLETVAAVPGMVGATINHLHCLRRICDDKGWIRTLMDEAENERMHLMTFIQISKPTLFERAVIIGVQWVFYLFFFGLDIFPQHSESKTGTCANGNGDREVTDHGQNHGHEEKRPVTRAELHSFRPASRLAHQPCRDDE